MCAVRSKEKMTKNKPKKKVQWLVANEMDYDEPHLSPNEKT
jgi:hypothetical protein